MKYSSNFGRIVVKYEPWAVVPMALFLRHNDINIEKLILWR